MRTNDAIDLADCTEFRHTLEARARLRAHLTALLVTVLLGGAMGWSAWTKANLVVRAPGRVRPLETPTRVFTAVSSKTYGRVAQVNVRQGQRVRRDEVLLRIDTEQLENEIKRHASTIRAAGEELDKLDDLETRLAQRHKTAQAKAAAELAQATAQLYRAQERRDAEICQAEVKLRTAAERERRTKDLAARGATTDEELLDAQMALREAEEKLHVAQLPVDAERVEVLRQALDFVEHDLGVRQAELDAERTIKRGELEAAQREFDNLIVEQNQATLRSPIDGVVTRGDIKVGDVLEPGKAAIEVAAGGGMLFESTVASEDIGQLRVGMPARIKFDAFDYQRYGVIEGRVTFISPDSNLPENPQGAGAPMYLVRIKLDAEVLKRGDLEGRVKLGMGGTAEIVTDRRSLLTILIKRIRQTISLG